MSKSKAAAEWPHSRRRILLAEDDDDFREALALALRNYGYEVIEVTSGQDVVKYLQSITLQDAMKPRIHALVTDLRMPDVNGMMLLQHLVSLGYELPTVMMTAFGDAETRREADELGAVAFLPKPFAVEDLETLLDRITGAPT